MRYKLTTLVDITESNIRRGNDKLSVGQQSNYDTLIQVIGLRANPDPIKLIHQHDSITTLGFGKSFKGKQKFWEFTFEVPDFSISVDNLKSDFYLVPIVNNLTESVKFNINVFNTLDEQFVNVVFEEVD
tara:strand:+ start:4107 stop:4493 length:387 start_codon:yes stop_codon:yes gene_type:complete